MTDPQQAAIDAAEDALRADIWDGDPEDIRFHSFSDGEVIG